LVGGKSEIGSLLFIRIITELRGDPTLLIQDRDAALQLGKHGVIASDMNRCRHAKILLNDLDEISLQIPVLDTVIVAIANQQQGLALTVIQRNSMTGIEF